MTNLVQTLAQSVFQQCFGLKPQESVLIVTDTGKRKEAAAEMKKTLELKPTPMLKEYAQLMFE